MKCSWNLRGKRINAGIRVSVRLVCDLIDDGHDSGKSGRGGRCPGNDAEVAVLLDDVSIVARRGE